jgi:hypothetical protein
MPFGSSVGGFLRGKLRIVEGERNRSDGIMQRSKHGTHSITSSANASIFGGIVR